MGRFNMWIANLMRGRYGMDNFNRSLMIVGLVLIIVNMFLRSGLLNFLIVLLLIYIYCRMFSRNINARYGENQKYLQFISRFKNRRSIGTGDRSETKSESAGFGFAGKKDNTHRILRCPGCGEKLRVPKGAGKINIHCPYCNTSFIKKV